MDKMQELINELNEASKLYYNGRESFLSDKEFDEKINELKALEQKYKVIYANSPTVKVGAPVLNALNKVTIKDKPMLSLDKVHSAEEIKKFSDGYDIIASIKCDGLSVRLIYENTDLVSANTRGDGYIGGDITEHIKHFLNVPLKIATPERFIIDGEAIIYDDDFSIVNRNGEFKNNRNTASGSLALLDMSVVADRRLSFIAWNIIAGSDKKCYHHNLEYAKELGFTTVPALALDCTKVEENEINEINRILLEEAKEKGIPCDGVVWKINDIAAGAEKGQTSHHFLDAVAWKPEIEEYETKLIDIEWTMGRTGILTPVAIVEPIEIDGSVIERASLHNLSVMRDVLGIYPDKDEPVWIYKANLIIPQISRAVKNDIPHDHILHNGTCDYCPICGEPTKIVTSESGVSNVVCDNPNCNGKLINRIDHFCGKKGLDIKGLSKKTIEKLIEYGWLNGIKDIYGLEQHKNEWESKPGFGEASVSKILDAIQAAGRHTKLDSFISAIGIPLVGKTTAKILVKEFSTWQEFRDYIDTDDCFFDDFDGIGEEINNSLKNFDYSEADEIAAMITFEQSESQDLTPSAAIQGKTFCITGKVTRYKNRTEFKEKIESLGGKVTDSVTKNTSYLINNDINSTSSKNKKAKELGIPIITEEEFENFLKTS